jgi:nucleotide-binding universal stress UspA family protein
VELGPRACLYQGDPVKVLIAVKGTEGESFLSRLLALGPLNGADEVMLAHVVDTEPRSGVEAGRDRFMVRRTLGPTRSGQIEVVEEEHARAVLTNALQTLLAGGISPQRIHQSVLRGKPNEALRRLAEDRSFDLIVVGGRPGKPGPHSLGKTARFLVDHAPAAALLVR